MFVCLPFHFIIVFFNRFNFIYCFLVFPSLVSPQYRHDAARDSAMQACYSLMDSGLIVYAELIYEDQWEYELHS